MSLINGINPKPSSGKFFTKLLWIHRSSGKTWYRIPFFCSSRYLSFFNNWLISDINYFLSSRLLLIILFILSKKTFFPLLTSFGIFRTRRMFCEEKINFRGNFRENETSAPTDESGKLNETFLNRNRSCESRSLWWQAKGTAPRIT